MNNNTFKNAFDTNFGANFNIATTNNINKIIDKHYNIYGKIYPKNLDSTQNKFQKNNEKRQIILKNSSSVNVLLTFFPYNNTNNSWSYGGNMLSFTHIKQIFREIFEGINLNSETILKNNSYVNVLLIFFHYNNTNNNWFCVENMFSFTHIKQGFWEKFREIFEVINKLINNTPDMFIRKINYITEKFTNTNYEGVLRNNSEKILGNKKNNFNNLKTSPKIIFHNNCFKNTKNNDLDQNKIKIKREKNNKFRKIETSSNIIFMIKTQKTLLTHKLIFYFLSISFLLLRLLLSVIKRIFSFVLILKTECLMKKFNLLHKIKV